MRKLILTYLTLLCATATLTAAQPLWSAMLDSDWRMAERDSMPPVAGFQHELAAYSPGNSYSARIEYPQLEEIGQQQLERWGLAAKDIPQWPDVSACVGVSRGQATVDVSFTPLLSRDGRIYAIAAYKAIIEETGQAMNSPLRGVQIQSVPAAERYTRHSVLEDGHWVKISVSESGIYKLTDSKLRSMGFKNPQKVRLFGYGGGMLPETDLQDLPDDLTEQPLWKGSGYSLFYARGPVDIVWKSGELVHETNTYSDNGYYFLTDKEMPQPVRTFQTMPDDSITGTLVNTFMECLYTDKDEFSWINSGRRFFESHDYALGNSRQYVFNTDGMVGDSVRLTVAFSAASDISTSVSITAGNAAAVSLPVSPSAGINVASIAEKTYRLRSGNSTQTTVRLVHNRTEGVSGHLDFIRLNYRRSLELDGPYLLFRSDAAADSVSFSVKTALSQTQIWQIGKDSCQARILSCRRENGALLSMAANVGPDDILLAVDVKGSFPEPKVVETVQNQNLHGMDSLDMVIVVPRSGKLTAQAERLAQAHRQLDGLRVAVVRADQVYNEFSSGTPDATAVRRFMKMLYDRQQQNPVRYLLLMGRGAWDNRMHVDAYAGCNPDDYLLCYESYNSVSQTGSYVMEDYFGLLDDTEGNSLLTEKTDLGVGRMPVLTGQQAKEQVDKLIDYMSGKYQGKWCNEILVLGDDGDNNCHMEDADAVADLYEQLYPDVDVTKVFWDAYPMVVSASYNSYPKVRELMLDKLSKGVLLVNYSGHGSTEVLSHELVFKKADASALETQHPAFWITASCDIAPFDSPNESVGLNLVNNAQGGAIGMLSTTRSVYASLNKLINQKFSSYVLAKDSCGMRLAVGDALRLAKNALVSGTGRDLSVNKLHYALLCDPALKLGLAQLTAVIDSIDGQAAADGDIRAKAGSVMSVSGHIECDGVPVPDFNGLVYSTVFDSRRTVTGMNNLKTADCNFKFETRDRILSQGSDSVKDGRFDFSFPVPLDIYYSDQSGRISLLAVSDDRRTANGSFTDFTVGGTVQDMAADSVGPIIGMYLNKPGFQYGASVNSTPTLVVELSDASGLNTSGNGLGHDIMLVIDGDVSMTWNLNDYFVPASGDWTKGQIVFSIPEIPEGRHTLTLRAWDNRNNSSSAMLGFRVENGLAPALELDVTESPARESTRFVVSHDRPMGDISINVRVYDSRGTLQWTRTLEGKDMGNLTILDWNLCSSAGHRLPDGLYIAVATVRTAEGSESANCKLVILNQ